jgi:alkylation response protein AidB-like acyl-CoA dehydrogenase
MDFTFTDDQEQLRRAVRQLGAGQWVRDDPELWRTVTEELGLTGIGVAPERGGAGGDFIDAAVVVEEAGRTLLPAPVTSVLVAGAVLDSCGDAGADGAAAVAAGQRVAVVGVAGALVVDQRRLTGTVPHVVDGDVADVVVIAGADALWLVDVRFPGVQVEPSVTLDATRGQASLSLDGATGTRLGDRDASQRAIDLLRVALSVEAVGAARHCLELTVGHLKTREQFGRPIGSFQALQHRAADLVVDLEVAASTAYYAAWAAAEALHGESADELAVVAPLAKAVCAEAAWRIAAQMIQLHGGIGFTWEHDAHRYFKRLTATRLLLGDAHAQRRIVAERAAIVPGRAGR